jgi:nucleotide-binding universal stress UspA family protein
MKTFLLLMHNDSGQEARFQIALDLVRAHAGHLTCLNVATSSEARLDGYASSETATFTRGPEARDAMLRYHSRLEVEDIAWNWQDATGDAPAIVARAAAFADLIILSSQLGRFGYPGSAHLPGDVLMRANRPVMAVPQNSSGIAVDGSALIAWDGSHTANAALRGALPLLYFAREVVLFEAIKEPARLAIEDAALYLSRHGIHARVIREPAGTSAADAIRRQIRAIEPAYLVMGAFGHDRLEQGFFGGVTQSMLSHCDLPVLLSH